MAFAHILNITNHVASYAREVADGKWTNCPDFCFWDSALTELAGKTMGIVGLGNTGMATARIAIALGMKVVAMTSKSADTLPEGACLSRRGQPSLPTHAVDTSSHQCRIHSQDETIGHSDQHRTRSACRRAGCRRCAQRRASGGIRRRCAVAGATPRRQSSALRAQLLPNTPHRMGYPRGTHAPDEHSHRKRAPIHCGRASCKPRELTDIKEIISDKNQSRLLFLLF